MTMTDIVKTLEKEAKSNWAIAYEHDGWIEDAAKEIKRLRKDLSNSDYELNKALTEVDRLKAEVNQYENIIIPSWKREERLWREAEDEYSNKVENLRLRLMDDLCDAIANQARLVGANLSYQERIERLEEAADAALGWIESAEHKFDCPRNRDDYDCTCGRDEVIQQLYGAFEGSQ